MNILFIQNNGINESFIITDIASYLKSENHRVDLLIANEEKRLFKKIAEFGPQLVILPCPILDKNWYFNIAGEIKKRITGYVLFWGAAATFYPEAVLLNRHCDFICRGEGEYAIAELAKVIESKESYKDIRNIGYNDNGRMVINPLRPLVGNLDELPLPERGIYYKYPFLRNINSKRFLTSRGCKQLCNGCWNNAISNIYNNPGNFYRRKSPERVIEEILIVKEKYNLNSLHFSDDLFIHPDYHAWLSKLLRTYKEIIGIKFTCNVRPDYLTEEIVGVLGEAGCRAVAMSVESGCCRIRNEVLGKDISDEQIIEAADRLHKNKIKLMAFNLMAVPDEATTDVYKTIELNQRIGANYTRINMMFPICASDLYGHAREKNLLKKEPFSEISSLDEQLYKSIFYKGDKKHYKNLFLLFSFAVKFKISIKILKILVRLPLASIYNIIWRLVMQANEKRFFGVNLSTGIPYFLHTGGVSSRSENYTSIY